MKIKYKNSVWYKDPGSKLIVNYCLDIVQANPEAAQQTNYV